MRVDLFCGLCLFRPPLPYISWHFTNSCFIRCSSLHLACSHSDYSVASLSHRVYVNVSYDSLFLGCLVVETLRCNGTKKSRVEAYAECFRQWTALLVKPILRSERNCSTKFEWSSFTGCQLRSIAKFEETHTGKFSLRKLWSSIFSCKQVWHSWSDFGYAIAILSSQ